MTATQPYIGAMMSLLSKSDIRYTGILASIDVKDCTIGLARVRCYGTEGRSDAHEVPGSDRQHDYIVFKASDIKDLLVIGGSETTGGEATALAVPIDDPAIVSQKAEDASSQQPKTSLPSATRAWQIDDEVRSRLRRSQTLHNATLGRFVSPPQPLQQRRLSDGNDQDAAGDFDFEEANQRFRQEAGGDATLGERPAANSAGESSDAKSLYYDKQASFFDSISCESRVARPGGVTGSWMRSMRTNEETFGADSTTAIMPMANPMPSFQPPHYGARPASMTRDYGGGAMPYRTCSGSTSPSSACNLPPTTAAALQPAATPSICDDRRRLEAGRRAVLRPSDEAAMDGIRGSRAPRGLLLVLRDKRDEEASRRRRRVAEP